MNPSIRELFKVTEKYSYLNSAAVSPVPTTAIDAVVTQMQDVATNGSKNYQDWVDTKNRARALLASMLSVRPDQIGFTRNTSDGFATIANGLKWKTGDNIVSFAGEFPANFYPWRRIRDEYGVELRLVSEIAGRVDIDALIDSIDSNTRVVSISAIQFASGFRADLERVGRAARSVDALFCVDIIQGLGARSFNLPAEFVDAACGASHKWLCAPEGCGYIFLSDRARERVEPTLTGWISVDDPWNFLDREQSLKPTALAWESGTGPAALFYGLEQSLQLLTDTGFEKIEHHLATLTDHLCESLKGTNYEVVSSRSESDKSAIVCIRSLSSLHPNHIAAILEQANIIVSPRIDRIRIAPHFYNDLNDIDRLIEALP